MEISKLTKAFLPSTIITDLKTLTLPQASFMGLMLIIMVGLSVYWGDNTVGLLAGVTGVICVFMVNMRKMSNFAWGLINSILYGYVAYTASYYGDVMLNWLFYLPVQLIGAYFWYDLLKEDTITVRKISSVKTGIILVLLSICTVLLYSSVLTYLGGALTLVDATTTTLSVLATFFMIKGFREQWVCWIIINILSIYMWVQAVIGTGEGAGVLIMWIMFLMNSLYGAYNWFKYSEE